MTALELTDDQRAAVEQIARFIVRFELTVPAILAAESMRPLSFVGSQFMHMLTPSVAAFLSPDRFDALARLLEDRRGIDVLISEIERADAARRSPPPDPGSP